MTDFVCYYGKQTFNLTAAAQRQTLDKLLDNKGKVGSNTGQNNSGAILDSSILNSNLSPSSAGKKSFWQKNKLYIRFIKIKKVKTTQCLLCLWLFDYNLKDNI